MTDRTYLSRRERLQQELQRDVLRSARRILASSGGLPGLTMAAVAKSVGVTPPALYRYFDGRSELVAAVYEDVLDDLLRTVWATANGPDLDGPTRLAEAMRAVFRWSVAHPAEFDLVLGNGYRSTKAAGMNIERVFSTELARMIGETVVGDLTDGISFPADDQVPERLREQVRAYGRTLGDDVPLGLAYAMAICWRQVYGVLCMAVYGHQSYAYGDHTDLFEDTIDSLLGGLRAPGPEPS